MSSMYKLFCFCFVFCILGGFFFSSCCKKKDLDIDLNNILGNGF